MAAARGPNLRLRALLAEAAITGQALAEDVNRAGRESSLTLRYDRTSVAHWLRGIRPRPPVPELVAEALSRRLGRAVHVADTGLGEPRAAEHEAPPPRWLDQDAAKSFTLLAAASTPGRRGPSAASVFSVAALELPSWPGLARLAPLGDGRSRPGRAGRAEIASVEAMTALFSDTDAAFGGRRAAPAAAGYLAVTVAPWLDHASGARARGGLLAAAARLSYLAGFMCFDDNRHAEAQRYYLTSLRLAREAEDAHAYAVTLRALGVQARALGHHREALDLAEAALASAPASVPEQTRAFMLAHLAAAHAAVGEHRAASAALARATRHLDRAGSDAVTTTIGAFHRASMAHCRAVLCTAANDKDGAIAALTASLRHRPESERRSRALTRARLAELHWERGDLETACAHWRLFLDDYAHLGSGRADSALTNLRALTRPQQRRPEVSALRHRVTHLTGR